jgi:hypothetical protein
MPAYSVLTIVELALLTFYLAMLSFFLFVFALRAVFPVLLFLGKYTTDEDLCYFWDCGDLGGLFSVCFGSSFDTWSCWSYFGVKKLAKR